MSLKPPPSETPGGIRSRARRRPPNPPSGPAHEEHGHRARMPRVRRENELPRGAHRHQKGEGGENAGGERAAGLRSPLRRPPRDHQRRGCRKIRRGAPKMNSTWPIPRRPGSRPREGTCQTDSKILANNTSPIWLLHMRSHDRHCMPSRERAGGFWQGYLRCRAARQPARAF